MADLWLPGMGIATGAILSPCRTYRYALWRTWAPGTPLVVIGLNPSTADETEDDATIRRCVGYARREGAGGLWMLNLFALRSTDPRALAAARDPIGPENNDHLDEATRGRRVLCAWGAFDFTRFAGRGFTSSRFGAGRDLGVVAERARRVIALLAGRDLVHLGLTKNGRPKHPLYLRADAPLIPFGGPARA